MYRVPQVRKVHRERQHQVVKGIQVLKVLRDLQIQARKVLKAQQDLKDQKDLQVAKELKGDRELREEVQNSVPQGLKEPKVHSVLAPQVFRVTPETLVEGRISD
jgi:hypothetical protein